MDMAIGEALGVVGCPLFRMGLFGGGELAVIVVVRRRGEWKFERRGKCAKC